MKRGVDGIMECLGCKWGALGANRCVGGEKGCRVSWVFGAEMGCFEVFGG